MPLHIKALIGITVAGIALVSVGVWRIRTSESLKARLRAADIFFAGVGILVFGFLASIIAG